MSTKPLRYFLVMTYQGPPSGSKYTGLVSPRTSEKAFKTMSDLEKWKRTKAPFLDNPALLTGGRELGSFSYRIERK